MEGSRCLAWNHCNVSAVWVLLKDDGDNPGDNLMTDARTHAGSDRRSAMAAAATLLAVGCGAVVGWAVHGSAQRPQPTALFKAPAVAAATAVPRAEPGKGPAQAWGARPAAAQPTQPSATTPVDPKKQVPRVDLVISHLADERGMIDPCG